MRNVLLIVTAATVFLVPREIARAQAASPPTIDPRITKLAASISEERLQQLLQKLSSYKTRNTCSDPSSPDGVGAARQWIYDELKRTSPKLQVSFDTYQLATIPRCTGGPFELSGRAAEPSPSRKPGP